MPLIPHQDALTHYRETLAEKTEIDLKPVVKFASEDLRDEIFLAANAYKGRAGTLVTQRDEYVLCTLFGRKTLYEDKIEDFKTERDYFLIENDFSTKLDSLSKSSKKDGRLKVKIVGLTLNEDKYLKTIYRRQRAYIPFSQ